MDREEVNDALVKSTHWWTKSAFLNSPHSYLQPSCSSKTDPPETEVEVATTAPLTNGGRATAKMEATKRRATK